ncbi:MAG TPA: hypothetical protein EYF98_11795 [Planctomycetes bacterium]|nr:hypothetical protein [Planctomycetota bacterium]
MNLTHKHVMDAAERAAKHFQENLPGPEAVFSRIAVYDAGGFPYYKPGDVVAKLDIDRWNLTETKFISAWRERLAAAAGRYPQTVPGEGFRLLTAKGTVGHGILSGEKGAQRAFEKGVRIMDYARPGDLDYDTKMRLERAQVNQSNRALTAKLSAEKAAKWDAVWHQPWEVPTSPQPKKLRE